MTHFMKFQYTNWRGEEHEYVVDPEKLECAQHDGTGYHPANPLRWVLHARVVRRDGVLRYRVRRTFLLDKMLNIRVAGPEERD